MKRESEVRKETLAISRLGASADKGGKGHRHSQCYCHHHRHNHCHPNTNANANTNERVTAICNVNVIFFNKKPLSFAALCIFSLDLFDTGLK